MKEPYIFDKIALKLFCTFLAYSIIFIIFAFAITKSEKYKNNYQNLTYFLRKT